VLWGSYGGVYGVELSNRGTRYGPVWGDTLALSHQIRPRVEFRFGVERLNRLVSGACPPRPPRVRAGRHVESVRLIGS
jgi:hypothetical protein